MYAGTVSPSDPILAALTLSLRLSAAPLSERHLSLITGQPEENIRQILLDLEGFGFAAKDRSGVDLRHSPAVPARRDGRHGPGQDSRIPDAPLSGLPPPGRPA